MRWLRSSLESRALPYPVIKQSRILLSEASQKIIDLTSVVEEEEEAMAEDEIYASLGDVIYGVGDFVEYVKVTFFKDQIEGGGEEDMDLAMRKAGEATTEEELLGLAAKSPKAEVWNGLLKQWQDEFILWFWDSQHCPNFLSSILEGSQESLLRAKVSKDVCVDFGQHLERRDLERDVLCTEGLGKSVCEFADLVRLEAGEVMSLTVTGLMTELASCFYFLDAPRMDAFARAVFEMAGGDLWSESALTAEFRSCLGGRKSGILNAVLMDATLKINGTHRISRDPFIDVSSISLRVSVSAPLNSVVTERLLSRANQSFGLILKAKYCCHLVDSYRLSGGGDRRENCSAFKVSHVFHSFEAFFKEECAMSSKVKFSGDLFDMVDGLEREAGGAVGLGEVEIEGVLGVMTEGVKIVWLLDARNHGQGSTAEDISDAKLSEVENSFHVKLMFLLLLLKRDSSRLECLLNYNGVFSVSTAS